MRPSAAFAVAFVALAAPAFAAGPTGGIPAYSTVQGTPPVAPSVPAYSSRPGQAVAPTAPLAPGAAPANPFSPPGTFAPSAGAMVGAAPVTMTENAPQGRDIVAKLMAGRFADWERRKVVTAVASAPVHLSANGQFIAVRVRNDESCDANGCLTFIFSQVGGQWHPIFQDKAKAIAVSAGVGAGGMSPLVVDGEVWHWDGSRYDTAG